MKSYERAKYLIQLSWGPEGFTRAELWYIADDSCEYLDHCLYLYYSKRELLRRFRSRNGITGKVCIVEDERYR